MGLGPTLERHNAFQWDLAAWRAAWHSASRSVCLYPKPNRPLTAAVWCSLRHNWDYAIRYRSSVMSQGILFRSSLVEYYFFVSLKLVETNKDDNYTMEDIFCGTGTFARCSAFLQHSTSQIYNKENISEKNNQIYSSYWLMIWGGIKWVRVLLQPKTRNVLGNIELGSVNTELLVIAFALAVQKMDS